MDTNRPWDQQQEYAQGQLKKYAHWALEVSYRQHTLGNYIIFCKENVERISELSKDAILELLIVTKEIEQALCNNSTFQPDRFNYWQMGNQLHRLHFHGIPRYKNAREFAGKTWVDSTYGHCPVWSQEEVAAELVAQLRDSIKKFL